MKIDALKVKIEEYRVRLKEQKGKIAAFSETGPVGMSLIDSIAEVLEAQEKRIKALEDRPNVATYE